MSIASPQFCLAGVAALLFTAGSVHAEETRSAALDGSLRRLDVTLVGSVTIELGAEAGYVLSAEDGEALEAVEIKTTGNRLIVKQRGKKGGWFWNDHDRPAVDLTVTLPAVEAIDLAGAGRLVGTGFEGAELEVSLAGAGECELTELRLDRLGMNRANRSGEFIDEVLIVLDLSAKVVERLSIFLPRLALLLLFNPHLAVSFDDIRDRVPMEDSLQVPQLVSPEHSLHLLDQVRGPAVELKLLP